MVSQRVPVDIVEVRRQVHFSRAAPLVEHLVRDHTDRHRRIVDRQHRHLHGRTGRLAVRVRDHVGESVAPVVVRLRRVGHATARGDDHRPVRRPRCRLHPQLGAARIRVVRQHVHRHRLVFQRHNLVVRRSRQPIGDFHRAGGRRRAAPPIGYSDAERHAPSFIGRRPPRGCAVGRAAEAAGRRAPDVGQRVTVRVRRGRCQPHLPALRHYARIA